METGETLKIFVCETFVVNGGPKFETPAPVFSMPDSNSYPVIGDIIVDLHGYARPPTFPLYQVRTKMAVAI